MKTIKLQEPVHAGDKEYKELTLGKIKAKHLRLFHASPNPTDNEIELLAAVAEVSPKVIDELSLADYRNCTDYLKEQLAAGKH